MHLHQAMLEIHKELSGNTTKLDRVIADVGKIEIKLAAIESSFSWFKGFFAAAAVLIPLFMGIVWWLIGNQITDLKNEILRGPVAPQAQPLPPNQKNR